MDKIETANKNVATNLERLFTTSGMSRRAFSARLGLSDGVTRRISRKLAAGQVPSLRLETALKLAALTGWTLGGVTANPAALASLRYVCRVRDLKPALKKVSAKKAPAKAVVKKTAKTKAVKAAKPSTIPPLVEIPVASTRAAAKKAPARKRKAVANVTDKTSGQAWAFPGAGRTKL